MTIDIILLTTVFLPVNEERGLMTPEDKVMKLLSLTLSVTITWSPSFY